jgi:hypothetical protein
MVVVMVPALALCGAASSDAANAPQARIEAKFFRVMVTSLRRVNEAAFLRLMTNQQTTCRFMFFCCFSAP